MLSCTVVNGGIPPELFPLETRYFLRVGAMGSVVVFHLVVVDGQKY